MSVTQSFTPRERAVLVLLWQGATNKQIAHQLGVSAVTVNRYVHSLMKKTGSKSRLQVVLHFMSQPEHA